MNLGRRLGGIVLLAGAYALAARLGLIWSLPRGMVSPFWPAAGVALVGLLLGGPRLWPGVFLGVLLGAAGTGTPVSTIAVIAGGNTLAALAGVTLLRRSGFRTSLDRTVDVVGLAAVSLLAPVVSASLGTAALLTTGGASAAALDLWSHWWAGDVFGTSVIAALAFAWSAPPLGRVDGWRAVEAVAIAAALAGMALLVYVGGTFRPSMLYPFVMWAALRFGLHGGTAAAAIVASIAVWGTAHGLGPLVAPDIDRTIQSLQIVIGVTLLMALVVGVATVERKRTQEALRRTGESLRALVEAAPAAIVAFDLDGRVTSWNAAAEQMFGYTTGEAIGHYAPWVAEQRHEEFEQVRARQTGGEAVVGLETVGRRKDGGLIDISYSAAPTRGPGGRIGGAMAVIEDISRRRESEARLHTALESLPFDFWILGEHGRYVLQNSASVRNWGHRIGLRPEETGVPPEVLARWQENNRRASAGEVVQGEAEYLVRGDRRAFFSVVAPVVDAGSVRGILGINVDVTERKRAEEALVREREILQTIVDHIPAMICFLSPAGELQWANRAWERTLGWTLEEARGRSEPAGVFAEPEVRGGTGRWTDCRVTVRDGRMLDTTWAGVRLSDGGILVIGQDITERMEAAAALRRSEADLRQAQKMEAVGRLAGGVAHDFNNLLTSILGHTELLLDDLREADPLRADLDEIRQAAGRAARLTGQLLAFSRRQVIEPKVLDLNGLVTGVTGMLRRLLGEHIQLHTRLAPDLGRVVADPGQIEQVIINLAVNARDAMPGGGRLTIETADVVLDDAFAAGHAGAPAGPHVVVAVHDEGVGMDGEVQSRMFEPFFTTKPVGHGTGLGLATVYGIVKQSDGYITVASAPGQGTSMRVYFKRVEAAPEATVRIEERPEQGAGTILLVEDEDGVRGLTRRILAKAGYTVLAASGSDEALHLAANHPEPIDLLLSDVVMSGLSGPRMADAVLLLRPGLPVIFMSGYSEEAISEHGTLRAGVAYLQKPFTPSVLTRKVSEVLRQGSSAASRVAG